MDSTRRIWEVLADNNEVKLPKKLLDDLVAGFEGITPRDIKMLLRLALRVAAKRNEKLSIDIFRQCAIFRGLHYSSPE